MTERKSPGMTLETWVERQIREAQERGEFDNLPGAGNGDNTGRPGEAALVRVRFLGVEADPPLVLKLSDDAHLTRITLSR